MTTEREDRDAWRTHEVPTFTQAEDTWLFGLTAKQLLGVVIAVVLGYVVFQFAPLWFLPFIGSDRHRRGRRSRSRRDS